MDLKKALTILKNNNRFFFKEKCTKEKIKALDFIITNGSPIFICDLIPFLKDSEEIVREKVCDIILELFYRIDSRVVFNSSIKYCNISYADINFYKNNFSKHKYIGLLKIFSLNFDGYIREYALGELYSNAELEAITFILYRLSDWVPKIRKDALKKIKPLMITKNIDYFIQNIKRIDDLKKINRINLSEIHKVIIDFIMIENYKFIVNNFQRYSTKIRIILAKYMSQNKFEPQKEILLLLQEHNPIVRTYIIKYFDALSLKEIDLLLNDKISKIRYEILLKLEKKPEFKRIIKDYISDSSSNIRYFARYILKVDNIPFQEIYYSNLKNKNHILGSLNGLQELNGIQYIDIIREFLFYPKLKVQKAAFNALKAFNNEEAYIFAMNYFDEATYGMKKFFISILAENSNENLIEKMRKLLNNKNIKDIKVKLLAIKFFSKIGSWSILSDFIKGLIDSSEEIQKYSLLALVRWEKRAVSLYTIPNKEDIISNIEAYIFVKSKIPTNRYLETRILDSLEFYIYDKHGLSKPK